MIVYTLSHLTEEGWITDCFRTKREAHKRLAKLKRDFKKHMWDSENVGDYGPYITTLEYSPIKKWSIKNKDDLVNFGNAMGT